MERTSTCFVIQNVGTEGKADSSAFDFIIFGQNTFCPPPVCNCGFMEDFGAFS